MLPFLCSNVVCKFGGKQSPVWSFVFVWEMNARRKRGNNNRLNDGSVVEPLSRSIQCKIQATLDFFTKSPPLLGRFFQSTDLAFLGHSELEVVWIGHG